MPGLVFQDRDERIVEELKVELALIRRDLIERLRRIEEYITFLESDVGRLRLDLQRINDKLIERPAERVSSYVPKPTAVPDVVRLPSELQEILVQRAAIEDPRRQLTTPMTPNLHQPQQSSQIIKPVAKREGLNQTEVAIIRYLIDNPGTKSATPIAQAIGKAREHVARTLKKLSDEKKIIRNETTWPYTHVVPDDIKKAVSSQ